MIFNLFSKRLVDVVVRSNNLAEGTFGNISNDLGDSIENYTTPMLQMAYAYARRSAAAGLFLQGIFSRNMFDHVQQVFQAFQLNTGHTAAFQEKAAAQANELLQSYDPRLTKDVVGFMTSMVVHNQTPEQYNGKYYLPYETVIKNLEKVISAGKKR